jgi:hypothetical protein
LDNIESQEFSMEVPYFQCPNDIFDKRFFVNVHKRKIIKQGSSNYDYDYCTETRLLNVYEKCIYCYLARCCNSGKKAFPKYKTIAEKCGCSESKVKESIEVLYDNSFIYKKNRGYVLNDNGQIRQASNTYQINSQLDKLNIEQQA